MKPLKPKYKWKSRHPINFFLGTLPVIDRLIAGSGRMAYSEMNSFYSRTQVLMPMFEIGGVLVGYMPDPFSPRNLLVDLSMTEIC